jgi:hypothetical protein
MRALCAAAVIAVLTGGPVDAQSSKSPTLEDMMGAKTPDQIEKEQATEKAYKESLKKIPDAKKPADPWGSARGTDAAKETSKTSKAPVAKKPPAKTGSTAN